MDPENGNSFKFIQVLLTAFLTAPTVLTIFTIPASLEIPAGFAVGAACLAGSRPCPGTAR